MLSELEKKDLLSYYLCMALNIENYGYISVERYAMIGKRFTAVLCLTTGETDIVWTEASAESVAACIAEHILEHSYFFALGNSFDGSHKTFGRVPLDISHCEHIIRYCYTRLNKILNLRCVKPISLQSIFARYYGSGVDQSALMPLVQKLFLIDGQGFDIFLGRLVELAANAWQLRVLITVAQYAKGSCHALEVLRRFVEDGHNDFYSLLFAFLNKCHPFIFNI